ncbi:VOC family protein [Pendulispora albinea]|uniref:VOC family protein n=1 Tax=Pendulispora albinea TaxID=2741071 RepID=A0ABZ2LTQ6_9BACT
MATKKSLPRIYPHLIVKGAARAIDFYVETLGAKEVSRFADTKMNGHIVHAELTIGETTFSLSEEARDWKNDAPASLGGSPVILTVQVEDARAVGERMVHAGATVVYPIEDQFYGARQGRLVDPFGHLWIITQQIEDLSNEEIQRRVDAWTPDDSGTTKG